MRGLVFASVLVVVAQPVSAAQPFSVDTRGVATLENRSVFTLSGQLVDAFYDIRYSCLEPVTEVVVPLPKTHRHLLPWYEVNADDKPDGQSPLGRFIEMSFAPKSDSVLRGGNQIHQTADGKGFILTTDGGNPCPVGGIISFTAHTQYVIDSSPPKCSNRRC